MKLKESRNCQHCNEPDFIEHFFFSCKKVQPLWKEIEKDLQAHLGTSISISEEMVLLGAVEGIDVEKRKWKITNAAITIGKLTVSKYRYGKVRNILEIYESESSLRQLWRTS